MTFFKTIDGRLHAVDLVAEIAVPEDVSAGEPIKHWQRECRVIMRNGERLAVEYGQVLVMLAAPAHMIPAAAGAAMVSYDGDRDRTWRTAIIAWAYTRKGEMVPVTATGVGYSRHSDAVVAPDGSVDNNLASWPNEDAWRAWAISEHNMKGDA